MPGASVAGLLTWQVPRQHLLTWQRRNADVAFWGDPSADVAPWVALVLTWRPGWTPTTYVAVTWRLGGVSLLTWHLGRKCKFLEIDDKTRACIL